MKAQESFAAVRDSELAKIQSEHVPGERHGLRPADWITSVQHLADPNYQFHKMFPDHPDHLPMREDEEEPNVSDPNADGTWDREDPMAAVEAEEALARGTAARLRR